MVKFDDFISVNTQYISYNFLTIQSSASNSVISFLSLDKNPFFYFFCFIQKMCPRLLPGPFCMDRHEFMVMRVNAVEIYEGGVTIVAIVCGNSDNREMVDPIQRSAPSLTVDRQKQRCEHLSFHFGCNSSS